MGHAYRGTPRHTASRPDWTPFKTPTRLGAGAILIHINALAAAFTHSDGMNIIVPIARILFSLIFIVAAPRHFTGEGIAHAAELGVPLARVFVPLSGALALVSGLSVAVGFQAKWGAWGLVFFLVPVTVGMHAFWNVADPALHHVQRAMFAKNLSLLGAALLITFFGAGPLSIDAARA
jgi:putative oxidoreductase